MIKSIGSQYEVYVDLPDCGRRGPPVNERRFSNDELVKPYDSAEELAQVMDEYGFDVLWLTEHHFQPEGYELTPNTILLGLHLSHVTKRLRFGCGFNVSTMWHPLRLAEDFAMADVLTRGRILFGMAKGYHAREVESLGGILLDKDKNRRLFEEQIEIVHRAFREEDFSHKGEFYTIPPEIPYRGYQLKTLTLTPRPKYQMQLHLPITSPSPDTIDMLYRYDARGVLSGGLAKSTHDIMRVHREVGIKRGIDRPLGAGLRLQVRFHLADTREKAIAEAEPWWEENVKMFAPFHLIPGVSGSQVDVVAGREGWAEAGIPTLSDEVTRRSFYAGTADGLIDYLEELAAEFPGLESVNLTHAYAAPNAVRLEQMREIGRTVLPRILGRAATDVVESEERQLVA